MAESKGPAGRADVSVSVKRVIASPPPTPKLLTKLSFSRVGPDVCLEAGFVDPVEMRLAVEAVQAGNAAGVVLYVTDRFVVPVGALPELLTDVKALLLDLESFVKVPPQPKTDRKGN